MADGVPPKKAMKLLDEALEEVAVSGNANPASILASLANLAKAQGVDHSEVSQEFVSRLHSMLSGIPSDQFGDAIALILFLIDLTNNNPILESTALDLLTSYLPE